MRSPVRADVPVTLIARYHGRPAQTPMPSKRPDAHPLGLTIDDHGGLWTMQEPFGAFTWYPSNDHPSDEALYDIAVTVPRGWSAIASGTPAGQQGQTFRYRSAVPVATYVTTLDLLHEFAHQWFGDSVTLTDWRDMWLNEGWALYVQKLYQMDAYGLSQAELVRTSRHSATNASSRSRAAGSTTT